MANGMIKNCLRVRAADRCCRGGRLRVRRLLRRGGHCVEPRRLTECQKRRLRIIIANCIPEQCHDNQRSHCFCILRPRSVLQALFQLRTVQTSASCGSIRDLINACCVTDSIMRCRKGYANFWRRCSTRAARAQDFNPEPASEIVEQVLSRMIMCPAARFIVCTDRFPFIPSSLCILSPKQKAAFY